MGELNSVTADESMTSVLGRYQDPVFILAPPRSYSTVTIALLAGHPDIYGFPELLLFTASTVKELLEARKRMIDWPPSLLEARLSGVSRTLADLHEGNQSDPAVARARRWLETRADWTTSQLMSYLLARVHPRIGLEKSPDTAMADDAIEACISAYPQARFIHLTRHPANSIRSMHAHYRRLPWKQVSLTEWSAWAWYNTHRRIVLALAKLSDDQWLRVRAEDLLRWPYECLPQVFQWLGLSCDAQTVSQMLHTEQWRFAGTGESGRLAGGDPRFLAAPALRPVARPGPLACDPEWRITDEAWSEITLLAGLLGY